MTIQELLTKTAADLAELRQRLHALRADLRPSTTSHTSLQLGRATHDLANIETSLLMTAALTPEQWAQFQGVEVAR